MLYKGKRQGHRAQVLVLPTGAGKTTVAAVLIYWALSKGYSVLFLTHQKELVDQAHSRLSELGVEAGVIMAGHKYVEGLMAYVATVQTLERRKLPPAQLVFVDEAHHSNSAQFQRLLRQYPHADVIGLTATPYRLDGKGLGSVGFTNLVAPTSLRELEEQGHLVPARYISHRVDLSGVRVVRGEYDLEQLRERFDRREFYQGAVGNYQKYAPGTLAVVYNVDVRHSQAMRDHFLEAGIPAAHLDASMPRRERERVLADFAAGKFRVLCNVGILTEGFNLPPIETVIINRATKSKSLYLQMVGRGLRLFPGKTVCTVIDQGGNVYAFGLADEEEEYTLEDRPRGKKKADTAPSPVRECPSCSFLQPRLATHCRNCGQAMSPPGAAKDLPKAEFEDVTGLLRRKGKKQKKKDLLPERLRKVPFLAMSLPELWEVAETLGYKSGWVNKVLEAQAQQKPYTGYTIKKVNRGPLGSETQPGSSHHILNP